MNFQLTEQAIDPFALRKTLISLTAGGYCSYEGWVRDHNAGKTVTALHYHGYPQLAPSIARQILAEAQAKFEIEDAAIVHRYGELEAGDIAVWVGVTAHHRDATFLACRYIIDNVKHRLPIWKKEVYADGTSSWIQSNHCNCADPQNLAHQAPSAAPQGHESCSSESKHSHTETKPEQAH